VSVDQVVSLPQWRRHATMGTRPETRRSSSAAPTAWTEPRFFATGLQGSEPHTETEVIMTDTNLDFFKFAADNTVKNHMR
jgi:hypothetical protein